MNAQSSMRARALDPSGLFTADIALLSHLFALFASPNGPILLQDVQLIDKIAHFDRERMLGDKTC
jgi:catalase